LSTGLDRITREPEMQGYWIWRFIAAIIDGILLAAVTYMLTLVLLPWMLFGWYMWGTYPLIIGILEIAYFVLLETMMGASIGKMALGFRVTTLDGQKPTMDKSLIRNLSKIYWLLQLLDFLLGLLTPGDPQQKYTDRIAGTRVVRGGPIQMLSPRYPPPPPPSYPLPPPSARVAYCPGCGAALPPGVAFCPSCGRKTS